MVNIEVTCPSCDRKKDCPWKGKFIIATEEHRLQFDGAYVTCPLKRVIYMKRTIKYKILKTKRHQPNTIAVEGTITTHATSRGKYSHKQISDMRKSKWRDRTER